MKMKTGDGKKRTIKSLFFYALQDNKEQAKQILMKYKLLDEIDLSHDAICEYIYYMAPTKFLWNNDKFYGNGTILYANGNKVIFMNTLKENQNIIITKTTNKSFIQFMQNNKIEINDELLTAIK